ncbi:MAG: YgiT-type zinc finger protein [Nitrospinae bacterium]|nr:YgiT-type zinc finger protein [Nitrospinota bacterium]
MKCIQCQGNMKKSITPLHIGRKGVHLMLESVPAWVCEQCGESLLEEKDVDSVQDLIKAIEQKSKPFAIAS